MWARGRMVKTEFAHCIISYTRVGGGFCHPLPTKTCPCPFPSGSLPASRIQGARGSPSDSPAPRVVITREAVVSNGVKYSGLYHKATSVFKMFTACSPSVVASETHDSGSCVLASLPCEEEQSISLAWAAPPSGGASGGACSGLFFQSPFGSA